LTRALRLDPLLAREGQMSICLQRREFIAGLGGAAAAWPLTAAGQQQKPIIGWLTTQPGVQERVVIDPFRRGLAEIGFLEGRDVTVEYHTSEGHLEQLPSLAADLVRRRVAVILAQTSDSAVAAKAATRTIPVPVVFLIGTDPVGLGLVASLNRPGGNFTGVVALIAEIAAKRLELLHKLVPATESIAMFSRATTEASPQAEVRNVQSAARTLGLRLLLSNATTDSEIAAAFATLVERQAGAVLGGGSVQLIPRYDQIISLAARYALPTMFVYGNAREGGLLSYGAVLSEDVRLAGAYTGRILKGEKPADLPVQLSTRFEFIINLKTARAIRLEIPPLLLALADEVIE
jgi:putative ABC transport system substrate-binding protein